MVKFSLSFSFSSPFSLSLSLSFLTYSHRLEWPIGLGRRPSNVWCMWTKACKYYYEAQVEDEGLCRIGNNHLPTPLCSIDHELWESSPSCQPCWPTNLSEDESRPTCFTCFWWCCDDDVVLRPAHVLWRKSIEKKSSDRWTNTHRCLFAWFGALRVPWCKWRLWAMNECNEWLFAVKP